MLIIINAIFQPRNHLHANLRDKVKSGDGVHKKIQAKSKCKTFVRSYLIAKMQKLRHEEIQRKFVRAFVWGHIS